MNDLPERLSNPEDAPRKKVVIAIGFGLASVVIAIAFFWIGKKSDEALEKEEAARSAIVSPAQESPVTLYIDSSEQIWLDGRVVSLEEMEKRLRELKPRKVLVRAEKTVKYPRLKEILGKIGQLGITNVGFTVVDKPGP